MNTNWSMLYSLHDRIFGRMMSAKIAELGPYKILFPVKAMIKKSKNRINFFRTLEINMGLQQSRKYLFKKKH